MRSVSPYERYGRATPITDAVLKVHVFKAPDTISNIAEQHLGDWRQWRRIAERNKLEDVRRIAPGTQLIIPRQELQKGRYEST